MEFAVGGTALSIKSNRGGNVSAEPQTGSAKLPSISQNHRKPQASNNDNNNQKASTSRRNRASSLSAVANETATPSLGTSSQAPLRSSADGSVFSHTNTHARAAGDAIDVFTSEQLNPRSLSARPVGTQGTASAGLPATSIPSDTGARTARQPVSMARATHWSLEVENAFRFQSAGFRDSEEYIATFGQPEVWDEENRLVKCLKAKKTGYFLYFRKTRECEDKHIHRIKLYQY